MRPGRSANADSPNAANYDEAKANPYPELPEILRLTTGENIDTPETWWKKRRPEITALLESEVYGRIPENVPDVKWEVRQTREVEAGGKPATQKQLIGLVDSSACSEIQVNISMSLTLPKDAKGLCLSSSGSAGRRSRWNGSTSVVLMAGLGLRRSETNSLQPDGDVRR